MAPARFKYQINHYLSIQPRSVSVDDVRKALEARFGIGQEIFNHDRFIQPDDAEEIPFERLEKYAAVLRISPDMLTQAHEPAIVYSVNSVHRRKQ